eukprot:3667346-Pyramimonas_sp.AAC.3
MVASTTYAAGGRRASQTPAQTVKQCAWRGVGVGVKQARGFGGLACPRALHAICLREWQQGVATPGQRALPDTWRGARYAKLCGSWRSPSTAAPSAAAVRRAPRCAR